ncbi:MAG: HEPN domain-containing protein [bacterium]|nr:HEPN domain-containing protein [bacterium]
MEELIKNWIKRAESDIKTAKDEINTAEPATDTICFHAQQCVEKYLKSYLTLHQKHFMKTHNIAKLIELCKEIDLDFDLLNQLNVVELTEYAVEMRYVEEFYFPTVEEAEEAIEIAEKVKEFVLEKFKNKGLNYVKQ